MSISGRYVLALPAAVAGYAVIAGYALPALRRLWLRRRNLTGAPATVNSAEEWAALGAARSGTRPGEVGLFAFYSSVAGAITTAPELMTLPIDDHAIVRGHAVFDTCTLAAGRMYRLGIHLQRFLQSARAARIPLPYGDDDAANVRQMAARTLRLRLRLSLSRSRSLTQVSPAPAPTSTWRVRASSARPTARRAASWPRRLSRASPTGSPATCRSTTRPGGLQAGLILTLALTLALTPGLKLQPWP